MTGYFDFSRFTPHGFCLAWDPLLVWLLAVSDLLIAAAYFSIPAALVVFARRRRDLAFKPVFGLFAAFIMACGTTHVMGALTLWVPAYRFEVLVNSVTAVLSVVTAAMLWPLLPKALALPSPDTLRSVNAALAEEVRRRDEAVEQLRASEARQKLLYARTPAALYALDEAGRLIDVSDRWLELTGYTREDVLGQNIGSFYAQPSQVASCVQVEGFRNGLDIGQGERQLLRRDGTIRDLEVVFEPERDADGKLVRILVAATDVTARKQAEQALRMTEEHLRQAQKMEAVGQLTGGIAHDFNNLLTTIMGSLELLQQRVALDDRGTRLAANALEGSRRAARLTSQLLSFSRRQRLAAERLQPAAIIEGIHDLLARTLGDGISLEVGLPAEPWALLADRNQMEAALLNLVINARDAITGPGGHVRIEVSNVALSCDETGVPDPLPAGDYVSIAVCDNGVGMTEEVKARAFEPFFTTKGPGAGTGLGLSQTYGFATQSGGALRIRSFPGEGTCIAFFLPRAPGPAIAPFAAELPPRPARDGRGEHILLVEDDALLRQTMADALRARGYRVTTAADGPQAVTLLDDGTTSPPFALLFTDVVMPGGLTGVDVALHARARDRRLPVLFATGYSSAATLSAWTEPVDLLPKPYSPEDVAARIAARLDMREAADAEPS